MSYAKLTGVFWMASHGLSDVAAYFNELRRYNMLDVASQISCPTLAIECEGDFAGGGGRALADAAKHVVARKALESSGHRAGRQHDLFDVLRAEELGR